MAVGTPQHLQPPLPPLDGGLTLVAHPKGKAVRRLAAMSGGEKSLTALSFLFALQRFRPESTKYIGSSLQLLGSQWNRAVLADLGSWIQACFSMAPL